MKDLLLPLHQDVTIYLTQMHFRDVAIYLTLMHFRDVTIYLTLMHFRCYCLRF